MSAKVMGAVMTCGPKKVAVRFVLVAIADNADDYGFAYLSMETIADKACCSIRNAIRLVEVLEREGWMEVRRHVFSGRSNVYFVDIEKLGVPASEKSSKSRMHLEVERMLEAKKPSDKLSPGKLQKKPEKATALEAKPHDNSQGGQVTKTAIPGDKNGSPILKNHCEPLKNRNTPLPPSSARGEGCGDCELVDGTWRCTMNCGPALPRDSAEDGAKHAVQLVKRECGWSDKRLDPVIEQALRQRQRDAGATDLLVCAGHMVAGWQGYLKNKHLLRYPIGERKFITRGWWLDDRTWPWNEERVREVRRL